LALAFRHFARALSICAAILMSAPAHAQFGGEDDMEFGLLTSAEQALIFDEGVTAYDAGEYARAFELWLPIAQSGNMAAQRNVAHMLRRGLGTEQNPERAIYFYRRAAEVGLVNAMINLGSMLLNGEGAERDDSEAAGWFYQASLAGDPRAQYVLGVLAARGHGMDKNPEAAVMLFRSAASQGLRDAQLRLSEAGFPLVEPNDPNQPLFDLPLELEPLPGISIAEDLAAVASGEPDLRLDTTGTGAE